MTKVFSQRFDDLIEQAQNIESNKQVRHGEFLGTGTFVDQNELLNWEVKVRNLLSSVCGSDSEHFKRFLEVLKPVGMTTNYEIFLRMKAVFLAAKRTTRAATCIRYGI